MDQPLFASLRRALRSTDPLDLLGLVSTMLSAVDPRGVDPFAPVQQAPVLDDLVDSFIGVSYAETAAALAVMRVLVSDEAVADRIERELAVRRQPMPGWLAGLGHAALEPDVWTLTHVLGDGDDYFIGIRLPSGHALSALVYVDHNLGTVVKDAFVISDALTELVDKVASVSDADQTVATIDPATARAVIEQAIEHGALMYPPLQSESWPACRPLVEWLVRLLPPGGAVPDRPDWPEDRTSALAEDFFASPFGAALDRPDERDLLGNLLWFGTDYGPGDPLRWSPVSVEMLLADWFPRKIIAPPARLAKLPPLLRAFIRYSHDIRNISAALTVETLAAVDEWEPDYQRAIRSARPQGPEAILAAMFDGRAIGEDDDVSVGEIMLEGLDRAVGGRFRLQNLDDSPLPDEPFEWAGIPDDIHPAVQEVLDACDRCANELFDVEHRTAMRRFLGRAAAADPAVFRRKASPVRGAAAVAWVICRANGSVGAWQSNLAVQDLISWFGLTGSVSQRAEPLLRANGVDPHHLYGVMDLGAPDLLTSERRREIIEQRDRYLSH